MRNLSKVTGGEQQHPNVQFFTLGVDTTLEHINHSLKATGGLIGKTLV